MINISGIEQFFKYIKFNVNLLDRTTPSELFKKFGFVDMLSQLLPYIKYIEYLPLIEQQTSKIQELESKIQELESKISSQTQG